MGKLFVTAMTPITMLWALAERHIWIAMALCVVATAIAWPLKSVVLAVCALFILSVLLMRVDPLNDAKAEAAAAKT